MVRLNYKIMKNFSQTFVKYHGCGNCNLEGTNTIIPARGSCYTETSSPFWKKPIDTCNKIAKSTRNQRKIKSKANRKYLRRYLNFVNTFQQNKLYDASLSSDYSTDDESESDVSETKQNLTDNEIIGENLIIDENTDNNYIHLTGNQLIEENHIIDQNTDNNHIHEHPLICSCTDKINTETPNNKETNNKIVPATI